MKGKKGRKAVASPKRSQRKAELAERERAVEARERTAAERLAVAEARERAAEIRDRASNERDALANERDRRAAERDALANERDRQTTERDGRWPMVPVIARAGRSDRSGLGRNGTTSDVPVTDLPATNLSSAGEPAEDPALERARLEAELQRAHLDGLTGAYRREVGRLALRNEIERARRGDGRFVLAFVDVDGLKGVNDRDGHAAGDKVLRTLAATMRANLRSYDPIVRYGGDEFVCGVSSVETDEVRHRLNVIDQSLRHATGVGVTAGLAAMTGNETLEELTERADAALLEAKRSR